MIALLNIQVKKMSLGEHEQRKEKPAVQSKLYVINTVVCFAWV
jgi:hypothetical protein